jgi:deoxyribodipyrimidine photo-lyase
MTSLLWLRQDLRLHDHPALVAACAQGAVIPVYILDDEAPGDKRMGGASRWWLHQSLRRLGEGYEALGARLILRRGPAVQMIEQLARETGATRVHAIRHYEPWWKRAEQALAEKMDLVLHQGNHLALPETLLTGGGGRYKVFTPWWRALLTQMPPAKPVAPPDHIQSIDAISSDRLSDWALLPTRPDWSGGFSVWSPGEDGARQALRDFLPKLRAYHDARNMPSIDGISRLSPHIHFGEISPTTIWHVASKEAGSQAETYLREIGWRDYATNLIDQFPDYPLQNGRAAYDRFAWRSGTDADADFDAWTKGQTGYPIVDAGMRELWATGFMHNRVRMIAASFLIKHLLIDWRRGEQWFWDTLCDADLGANASNWQWVAGTGVDAPMMSRIMAPLSQSEKFGAGNYVRKWVAELGAVSDPYIHDPDEFGVRPAHYPPKRIGHREARERALAAMRSVRDN